MTDEKKPFEDEDLSDPSGEGRPFVLRSYDPAEIRRWIKYMCYRTGLPPTKFAKAAGLAPSTLNRFLYSDNFKFTPSARTIDKISSFARAEYRYNASDEAISVGVAETFIKGKEEDEDKSEDYLPIKMFSPVIVRGRIGSFVQDNEMFWPMEKRYMISVPPANSHRGGKRFGLEISDGCMDALYPVGSVLVCIRGYNTEFDLDNLKNGMRVIINSGKNGIVRHNRIGEVSRDDDGKIYLITRSTNPKYLSSVSFDAMNDPQLFAVVVGVYRTE